MQEEAVMWCQGEAWEQCGFHSECNSCCNIQIIQGFAMLSSESSGNAIFVFIYRMAEKETSNEMGSTYFFPFDFLASTLRVQWE